MRDAPAGRRIVRLYARHAAEWDAEFARVSARFAERMQCRKGCSMCCSQMFSISGIEAAAVARAVAALPAGTRARLQAAARRYLDEAGRSGLRGEDGSGEESVAPRPGVRLQCPALEGDACAIYADRPLICRKWGIPVFDPASPQQLRACELNFQAGEAIPAAGLVEAQAALLERWVALKDEARETMGRPSGTLTVAEAILLDPDGLDPDGASAIPRAR